MSRTEAKKIIRCCEMRKRLGFEFSMKILLYWQFNKNCAFCIELL